MTGYPAGVGSGWLELLLGQDLPWSGEGIVARMGVEYRNDLLGHVHALGPSGVPRHYYAGHERSDNPHDWPPNKEVCEDLRRLDATVGYPHPVFQPFPADWSPAGFFENPRSVEARELVIDAALGVVDSVDLLSPFDDDGAIFLYHRLLSCGLRLTATAGTDAFLSFSSGPGVASNPPGWCRVYAHLGGGPLTVDAFKDAIRAGRTTVTNGPWLTLTVNGRPPGAVLDLEGGDSVDIRADAHGLEGGRLSVVGPDGTLGDTGDGHLELTVTLERPTWLAALARGPGHANILDAAALAHTSPVHLDIGGHRVARQRDARWCLEVLDRFEAFVAAHGRFAASDRAERLAGYGRLLAEARRFYQRVADNAARLPRASAK